MTVRELKELLNDFDEDMKIVMQSGNTIYADSINGIKEGKGIRAFYGDDYEALILYSNHQVGAVWDIEDLDLEG